MTAAIEGRIFNAKSKMNSTVYRNLAHRGKSFKNFVVVSPPSTILMICNGDQLILLDTHPVPPRLGGNRNGPILNVSMLDTKDIHGQETISSRDFSCLVLEMTAITELKRVPMMRWVKC